MRKVGSVIIIVMSFWLFGKCSNSGEKGHDENNEGIIVIKNTNPADDAASDKSVPVEHGDLQFATGAASGGMTEVAIGNLAREKAVDKRVKNFGAMMVKEHSKTNMKLQALAKAKNIQLPIMPLTEDQNIIDSLKRKTGKDFDKAYLNVMIQDHQIDIKQFEIAAKNCQDPDIKSFAQKMLPVLRNHLDAINTINDTIK